MQIQEAPRAGLGCTAQPGMQIAHRDIGGDNNASECWINTREALTCRMIVIHSARP
jgi:hypothetical protein